MQVRHLASLGFLLGWAFCVLTDPAKDTQHKVTYNVCDTPVCVERARLINESLNVSVDPCTDFYSYACGGWMSKHKIPESKPVTGTFILLDDELRGTLRDILGNMTLVCENQNITDKAAIVYNACVAVPDLEDRHDVVLAIMNDSGLAQWPKTRQDKCKKTDALNPTDVLIQTRISTILSSAVSRDSQNLSAYVIQLDQLAFSAVGRNQLINQTTNYSKPIIAAYKKVIEVAMKFMKPNLTDSELSELSGILLAFERKLANMTAPPEKRRDLIKLYHRTTIDELERNFSYVEDLTRRIMAAFNESLHTLKWMDNKTRAAAETKLSKMGTKIGYPNWLFNTTYIENLYNFVPKLSLNAPYGEMMYSIAQNNWKQELLKLRKPYDKDAEWIVGAAVVNAFYSASSNEMVFPSGILQGVFYEHGLPRSINFGAVGMVVGHEMTHGFDDKGSQFDAEGALKQWWTNETRAEFMKRTKCFVYEYGNITDKEANMTLNAKNTVGENIADNGGLRMAFEAYSQLLEKKYKRVDTRLKGLEDVSGKQLFFLSNAMVWCRLCRREYLKLQIQYDPHSPGPYRVNVPMSNLKAFSETFNCPANSTMNRKDRCSLW
ncbi:neprilysin-1-like isoform X4 [Dermacentor variabilis]|uniref:neprilysin-1-like isoform X4 n=1 Tax=Dermacentor variabilis TaxID=34621 RepID=UPI003F5B6796